MQRGRCHSLSLGASAQALEALRKLRTEKMAEVKEFRLRLDHLRTHKDNATRLRKEVEDGEAQERRLLDHIRGIEEQLNQLQQVDAGHAVLMPDTPSLALHLLAFPCFCCAVSE